MDTITILYSFSKQSQIFLKKKITILSLKSGYEVR